MDEMEEKQNKLELELDYFELDEYEEISFVEDENAITELEEIVALDGGGPSVVEKERNHHLEIFFGQRPARRPEVISCCKTR